MPNVLDEKVKVKRPGRKAQYPYDNWITEAQKITKNGKSFELVKGEDYNSKPRTMRHNIYREAAKRGLKAETTIVIDGKRESLVINGFQPREKATKKSK